MEFTLLGSAATAFAGVWIANRLIKPDIDRPTDLLIGSAAAGLFVGRIAAMLLDGVNPLLHPGDVLVVRAGVDTGFAVLGAMAALAWASKFQLPRTFDLLAPAALLGLGGWHLGCLWRGTCLGTVSNLPWAFPVSGSSVGRHPVEIYAALGMVLAAYLAHRLPRRPWLATGAALGLAAVVRMITQPFRPSLTGGPMGWYLAGLVAGVAVSAWSLRSRPKPRSPFGRAREKVSPPPV